MSERMSERVKVGNLSFRVTVGDYGYVVEVISELTGEILDERYYNNRQISGDGDGYYSVVEYDENDNVMNVLAYEQLYDAIRFPKIGKRAEIYLMPILSRDYNRVMADGKLLKGVAQ